MIERRCLEDSGMDIACLQGIQLVHPAWLPRKVNSYLFEQRFQRRCLGKSTKDGDLRCAEDNYGNDISLTIRNPSALGVCRNDVRVEAQGGYRDRADCGRTDTEAPNAVEELNAGRDVSCGRAK